MTNKTQTETIITNSKNITCDGENIKQNSHDSGHPKIYLNIGDENQISCPYCGQIYKYQK